MYRRIDCVMPCVYETPLFMPCTEEIPVVMPCVYKTPLFMPCIEEIPVCMPCVYETPLQREYLFYAMHVNTISSMPVCKKYLFGVQSHTF